MTLLDEIVEHNQKFSHPGAFSPLSKSPRKQLAIFTCMDTRLVDFLEPAMGLKRGDAKIIKNAGNTIIDPNQGGVIRSLVVAIYELGVEEVFVIGHEDCGMSSVDGPGLREKMIARGVEPAVIDEMMPDICQWVGAFSHPRENVARVVQIIRDNPLFPASIPIHGLIFSPEDGSLDVVTSGYDQS
ncbi:MAG: carbonic anhydrase [Trichlorobacter sp.]|jgi:carbonic anhydrase|nr:carbonic anhydrase [Trichlorobacter sp.]